jgi:hypothetical protein
LRPLGSQKNLEAVFIALGRSSIVSRVGGLQLVGAELLAVLVVDDPAPRDLDVLAGADGRGVADDGGEVLSALELHPQEP